MLYIYQKKKSITNDLCDKIIEYFNNEGNNRHKGVTSSGYQTAVKDTTDYVIKLNSKWERVHFNLMNELKKNIKIYLKKINDEYKFSQINIEDLFTEAFMVQKYEKNKGKFIYHHDYSYVNKNKSFRMITFIWYLNDIEDGGETEFFGEYSIKPEKGKLVLFPADPLFPHCGKMPLSDDKYIITGWLYVSNKKEFIEYI